MPRGGGGSHSSGGGSHGGGGSLHGGSHRGSSLHTGSHGGGSLHHGPVHMGSPRRYYRHGTHIYIGSRPGYYNTNDSSSYFDESEVMSKLTPEGQEKLKTVHKYEKISTFCGVFIVMAVVALILSTIIFSFPGVRRVDDIKSDYAYYHRMIETAQRNPDKLITTGTITQILRLEGVDKWYFEYEIYTDLGMPIDDYYIYSVFSDEEIKQFSVGDTIKVAVDTISIGFNTDSVPVMLEDYEYTDDGEYPIAKKNDNIYSAILTISLIVLVGGVIANAIVSAKKNKLADTLYQYKIDTSTSSTSGSKKKVLRCRYCGTIASSASSSCKNCGAAVDYIEETDE